MCSTEDLENAPSAALRSSTLAAAYLPVRLARSSFSTSFKGGKREERNPLCWRDRSGADRCVRRGRGRWGGGEGAGGDRQPRPGMGGGGEPGRGRQPGGDLRARRRDPAARRYGDRGERDTTRSTPTG